MGRRARRSSVSPLPKVEQAEVNDKHLTLRLVAAAFFFVVAVTAIAFGVKELLRTPTGWQEIDGGSSASSCASDFTLLYDVGSGGTSAKEELRRLKAAYSAAAERAYKLFSADGESEGIGNLTALNSHLNEAVELDPDLYRALKLVEESGDRTLYLGPAFEVYEGIFYCTEDWQRDDYDPMTNGELAALMARIAAFAADPESVGIELLDDNMAKLNVSREYAEFLEAQALTRTVDFGWMKNAFAADLIASALIDAGLPNGCLTSYDGFTRNFDRRGTDFTVNVYALDDSGPILAAKLDYAGPRSFVTYRDFPLLDEDVWQIAVRDDGTTRTRYLNLSDGLPHVSAHSLLVYGDSVGCGELALRTSRLYAAKEVSVTELGAIYGVQAVLPEGRTVYLSDPGATVSAVADGYKTEYLK